MEVRWDVGRQGLHFGGLERIDVVWDALVEESEDGRFDGSISARGHVSPF